MLSVSIDEEHIIPYIISTLNNTDLALRLAMRNSLPGVDNLVVEKFNQCLSIGDFGGAAKIAATSPRVCASAGRGNSGITSKCGRRESCELLQLSSDSSRFLSRRDN